MKAYKDIDAINDVIDRLMEIPEADQPELTIISGTKAFAFEGVKYLNSRSHVVSSRMTRTITVKGTGLPCQMIDVGFIRELRVYWNIKQFISPPQRKVSM